MAEVPDMAEVGRALDRVQQHGVKLSATLGQHCNDHMTSFYMRPRAASTSNTAMAGWWWTGAATLPTKPRASACGDTISALDTAKPSTPMIKTIDKTMSAADVVGQLADGMTIGIGGWGPRRKPMALVREILRSPLKDLTVVAYGGPEVGMLCAAGKVRRLVFGFVSLDVIPLEPYFRQRASAASWR